MPRVPYAPVPGVAPSEQGISGVRVDTPSAAFGASVARETEGLGKTIEQAGDRIYNRAVQIQTLNNETEAEEASSQYIIEAGKLHAQYNALEGKARVDASQQYFANLQSVRQNMRKGLSNDMSRRMFDRQSLTTMSRSIFSGANAAGEAQRQWVKNTANATLQLAIKDAGNNPDDEAGFQDQLRRANEAVDTLAGAHNWEPGGPQEQLARKTAISKVTSERIIGKSTKQPFEAQEMKERYWGQLTPDDRIKVESIVTNKGNSVGGTNLANQVFEEGLGTPTKPQMSLSDMEDEVRQRAQKQDPDNPLLAAHAISSLRQRWSHNKYATSIEQHTNEQLVYKAIQDGKTEQQILTDPVTSAAYEALPSTSALKKKPLNYQITGYTNQRDAEEMENNFTTLRGQASNDVKAFLETNLADAKLAPAKRSQLLAIRDRLIKNQSADPRVDVAMKQLKGAMGAQLEALKIFNRKGNEAEYDHFTGALQSALDTWQETHGKPATYKDVVETIGPQVIQQRSVPGFFNIGGFGTTNQKPFYEQDVPAAFKEKLVTDIKSRGGLEPTDEQVYKAYVRSQFIKLYGKKQGE